MTDKYDGAKFIHLQEDGCLGEVNQHYGGATVCYLHKDGKTYMGMAYCHPKDRYVKAYGRAKAMGMLKQVMAKPELEGDHNVYNLPTNFIFADEMDHVEVIEVMEDYGYVPR